MTYTIQNEFLTVSADDLGAELSSVILGGIEYLWQGNPAYWAYRAPILFPIVGKLKGGAMLTESGKYVMKNHGICRDTAFTLTEKSDDFMTFSLTSSEEIRKVYPYDFELLVTYKISERTLLTKLQVKNKHTDDIFFSMGGHQAFNCPLISGEAFEDYEIVLNEKEIQGTRLLDQDGMITSKTRPFFNDSNTIALDYEHYRKLGTLIFKNLNSNTATLRSKKSEVGVTMDFTGAQYFAVWTKPNAPFICLEPWQGVCDSSFYNGNFRGKTGTVQLAPNATHTCEFSITLF